MFSRRVVQIESLERRDLLCDPQLLASLADPPEWSDAIEAQARAAIGGGPEATIINWTNRNQSNDGFNATFGTSAEQMRGIVDAALLAWQQVITNWNRSDGSASLQVSIAVDAPGTGFGGAASPSGSAPSDGKPRTGSVSLGGGSNTPDPNDTNGWFADPSPFDNSEFTGDITNAYVGRNSAPGADFFSIVTIELAHVLGLISDRNNGGGSFQGYRLENFVTNTGITDTVHNHGQFFVFDGATVDHLMTGFNGGDPGPLSWGNEVHAANAPADINFAGKNWRGTDDVGNGAADLSARYLPSFAMAHILKDAYGYSIAEPMSFGTMHAIINETTGRLTVRGQTGNTDSKDVITVSFINGNTIRVSVNIGNDVPGTGALSGAGNLPAFVTDFLAFGVTEIRIDAGDGDDTINIESLPFFADTTVIGGGGDDTIVIAGSSANLDNVAAPITIDGGVGSDVVVISDEGSTNSAAYTLSTAGSVATFSRPGSGALTLVSTSVHTVNGAGGDNTFNVNGTLSGTTWTLNGRNGNDVFNIGTVGGNAELVNGPMTINGESGTDSFNYHDTTASGTPAYVLTTTQLTRTGNGTITYGTIESVRVDAGAGDNLITYNNTLAIGEVPVTLNGNGGNDTIQVDLTQQIFVSGSANSVDGGAGTDTLIVNNAITSSGFFDFTIIRNNFLNNVGANDLNYSTFESLVWNALNNENKSVFVASTAASTSLTFNGGNGSEFFRVGGQPNLVTPVSLDSILGPITFNGNGGNDFLSFNDHDTTAAMTYTLNGSTLTRTGTAPVSFVATENVDINAGSGADTIDVVDHPAGVIVTVDGRLGLDDININSDGAGTATARFAATQDLTSLDIFAGGTAVLTAGGNKVIDTDGLSIAVNGTLDLGDGSLIVDYSGASPQPSIRAALASGYNGGAWNGNGIHSTTAAVTAGHALGYAESSEIFGTFPATFAGRQVDSTAVLVRYTRDGDADLNQVTDGSDFGIWSANKFTSSDQWSRGDFNYDGVVDVSDFNIWNANKFTSSNALEGSAQPIRWPQVKFRRIESGGISSFNSRFGLDVGKTPPDEILRHLTG